MGEPDSCPEEWPWIRDRDYEPVSGLEDPLWLEIRGGFHFSVENSHVHSASRIRMYKTKKHQRREFGMLFGAVFLPSVCWCLALPHRQSRVGEHGRMARLFHFTVLAL